MVLPKHIPILWPDSGVAKHFLEELRKEYLVSDREMIYVNSSPRYYRAKRVFFSGPAANGIRDRGSHG